MATYTSSPFGFQQVGNYTQAEPNAQLASPAPRIKSGYAYPIFVGDPVTIYKLNSVTWNAAGTPNAYAFSVTTDGYLHSVAEFIIAAAAARGAAANTVPNDQDAQAVYACVPILGHFAGCQFKLASALNPFTTPFRQYWPYAQVTQYGYDALAEVIDDPASILRVQTDGTGAGALSIGGVYPGTFTWATDTAGTSLVAPYVLGDTTYGKSYAYLSTQGVVKPPFYPRSAAVTTAAGGGSVTIANRGSTYGGGYLIKGIDPSSTPQQLTVNGLPAAVEPYNTVQVVLQSPVYGRQSLPDLYLTV